MSKVALHYFSCLHGRVAVRKSNGNPLYLFLHGLGGSKEQFEAAFEEAPQGRGVIAVDLPGFGESDRFPNDIMYSFRNQAAAIEQVLDYQIERMTGPKVVLITHSMSSGLLPFLLNRREVIGVALLEANLFAEDAKLSTRICEMNPEEFGRHFAFLKRGARIASSTQLIAPMKGNNLKCLEQGYSAADQRAFYESACNASSATASGSAIRALTRFSGDKIYLRGDHSPPLSRWAALNDLAIVSTLIENAGHFPHLDNQVQTYSAIFDIYEE